MKKIYALLILISFFQGNPVRAQLDSIYDQSAWRTFIVHLPAGYSTAYQYPIVLNLHGLNSNAAQQQSYSQFDNVADTTGFIVVYPNGINNQWAVGSNTDVDFISHLIDTIRNTYSCNSCLFITGISDGGFMDYKLACALPQHISAMAVVAGNMAITLQNTCAVANGLPVMHFHGTADVIVNYNGVPPFIPPVDTTISWWVNENNCSGAAFLTFLPDINTGDSCTVVNYLYTGGINGSVVSFYQIVNGGHTWPGAIPVPPLGHTNQDINASSLMGAFFAGYCSMTSGINSPVLQNDFVLMMNTASESFLIDFPGKEFNVAVMDMTGRIVFSRNNNFEKAEISYGNFSDGMYIVQAMAGNYPAVCKKIMIRR